MREHAIDQPKRKYRKWTSKTDMSPVRRFRFTENEWKFILEAVTHYIDYMAEVMFPPLREQLNQLIHDNMRYHGGVGNWLGVKPGDPQHEEYQKVNSEVELLRSKVNALEAVERQLRLAFHLIDPKIPNYQYTPYERVMRL